MSQQNLGQLLLLKTFERLRLPLQLGADSYLIALQALKAGFGIENLQDFKQLCYTVWAKSPEDIHLIDKSLKDVEPQQASQISVIKQPEFSETPKEPEPEPDPPEDLNGNSLVDPALLSPDNLAEPFSDEEEEESIKIVQAIRQSLQELRKEFNSDQKNIRLVPEYFPVTRQQMQKGWLRMKISETTNLEDDLDIEATVQEIGKQGFLIKPIVATSLYRSELLMLLDWKGSMVPFHKLCNQLLETAQSGGQFRKVETYYFYNYPEHYFYSGPSRLKASLISDVLQHTSERTVILIISDAGAARGRFNSTRIEKTRQFIKQLEKLRCHYIWLNPMPPYRWLNTSAEQIKKFVPMFEMSHYALDKVARLVRHEPIYR